MTKNKIFTVKNITLIAMFTAIMVVLSWISITVGPVPFTLQTLAVFLTIACLGNLRALIVIILYIFLGAIGVPVFSGFTSTAALIGPTGGYIFGFLAIPLVGLLIDLIKRNPSVKWQIILFIISSIIGLILCYTIGTLWFYIYMNKVGSTYTLASVLTICVVPFIPFDIAKLVIAGVIGFFLRPFINKNKENELKEENNINENTNNEDEKK